jgi:hypothetical protein
MKEKDGGSRWDFPLSARNAMNQFPKSLPTFGLITKLLIPFSLEDPNHSVVYSLIFLLYSPK